MIDEHTRKVIKLMELFSDVEFQRKSWFGLGIDVSSPEEMCNNIDDINFDIWIEKNNDKISEILGRYIKSFIECIDKLPQIMDPFIAFSSNEWVSLRLKAKIISDLIYKELS